MSARSERYERFETSMNALLQFVNANLGSCIYFEPPIVNREMALRGMRISLDLWSDVSLIDKFVSTRSSFFRNVDYESVVRWKDALHGPMMCMETHGETALLLCEGHVIEAHSLDRSWDEMVPYAPDMILTTLVPFDSSIVLGGYLLHHQCHAVGPGLVRVKEEFEAAKCQGIVKGADDFAAVSKLINQLRNEAGLDPTSYCIYMDYIHQLNTLLNESCFPFIPDVELRLWDDDEMVKYA